MKRSVVAAWSSRLVSPTLSMFMLIAAPVCEPLWAQDRVEPDQPDVTNGTHTVDVGLLQIEIGGVYTRYDSRSRAGGSPITARLGLTDWFEGGVGTAGVLIKSDGTTPVSG